jgi:hypothetical protein
MTQFLAHPPIARRRLAFIACALPAPAGAGVDPIYTDVLPSVDARLHRDTGADGSAFLEFSAGQPAVGQYKSKANLKTTVGSFPEPHAWIAVDRTLNGEEFRFFSRALNLANPVRVIPNGPARDSGPTFRPLTGPRRKPRWPRHRRLERGPIRAFTPPRVSRRPPRHWRSRRFASPPALAATSIVAAARRA